MGGKLVRNQLLIRFLGLTVSISLVITLAILVAANENVSREIREELTVGVNVFDNILRTREQQLALSSNVLTDDFGFRQAVATRDSATIASALENHARRIGADLMLQLSLSGEVLAQSAGQPLQTDDLPLAELADTALQEDGVVTFLRLPQGVFQVVLVPVKAPVAMGVTVLGFQLDQQLAQELKQLTGLELTFLSQSDESREVLLSTLPDDRVRRKLAQSEREQIGRFRWPLVDQALYATRTRELVQQGGQHIKVVLATSLDSAYASFDKLQLEILSIALASAAVAAVLCILFANNLARPILWLVNGAQRIARGDYQQAIELKSGIREIDQLSDSLDILQSEVRQREEKILFQARHDHLTGLINLQTFLEQLQTRIADVPEQPFTLVVANIREFRSVNDTFGYEIGDQCLQAVANRLMESTEVCARVGSDFVWLIPGDTTQAVQQQAQTLLQQLSREVVIADAQLKLAIQLGLASYPDQGDSADVLYRRASLAVDAARAENHELEQYQEGDDEQRLKRVRILNDLRTLLQGSGDGQLELHYQPKLRLRDRVVDQVEALIRWHHPEMGFLPPDSFIPLAEQAGLISEVTRWVLRTAARQSQIWREKGVQLSIAVNISGQDFANPEFKAELQQLLRDFQLDASCISFEVTESAVIKETGRALTLLSALRDQGFGLAVDDFGTGYSSMVQLKSMPVTDLKIDKYFVQRLDQDDQDDIIVRTTIELAHQLGLGVVAEGVENEASLDMLADYGCDWIQGYFLSRPMPVAALETWLAERAEKSSEAGVQSRYV